MGVGSRCHGNLPVNNGQCLNVKGFTIAEQHRDKKMDREMVNTVYDGRERDLRMSWV